MNSPNSKPPKEVALENLRSSVKYFVGEFGKIGLIQIIREIISILQDEGYRGFPFFLDASADYSLEESDKAARDIAITWKRVARQIRYVVEEAHTKDRELW